MKTVIIAEKPKVAQAIAKTYAKSRRTDHFIDVGEDTLITWCYGHMLALKEPIDHDEKYKIWSIEHLPYKELLTPSYLVPSDKKEQLNAILKLCREADLIVHAGDPDDEGQRLVDEVLEYGNINKPVKRLLINDNNPEVIRKSFKNMKENKDFYNLSQKALARAIADIFFGNNLTVAFSKKFNSQIYVGRVSTSILSLVVNRANEHNSHIPKEYYDLENIFTFSGQDIKAKLDIPKEFKDEDGYIIDKKIADNLSNSIKNGKAIIKDLSVTNNKKLPPLLFNLLKLQIEASKLLKFKADETDAIAQKLYEKEWITYARSDSQYLSDEQHDDAERIIDAISQHLTYLQDTIKNNVDASIKNRVFDSKKVSAHHGIVPTFSKADFSSLSKKEQDLYKIIAERYLLQFMPLREIEQTSIIISCSDYEFKTSLNIEKVQGWSALFKDEDEDSEKSEPIKINLSINDDGVCSSSKVSKKKTKPIPLYTDATLLNDLNQVAKYIKDDNLKKILIEKDDGKEGEKGGIGTPSTRSKILKTLFDRNYLNYSKSKILPTDQGIRVFNILPNNIKYPDLTAEWQIHLNDIEDGKITLDNFLSTINSEIVKQISFVKNSNEIFDENIVTYPCSCGGQVRHIKTNKLDFWGCSNYSNGCDISYFEKGGKPIAKDDRTYPCSCGGVIKHIQTDKLDFWGCNNFKKCDLKYEEVGGKPVVKKADPNAEISVTYPCSCGGQVRHIKKDKLDFWGCSNYKKCDLKYEEVDGKPVVKKVVTYPCSCGGQVRHIKTDKLDFWGCSNYKKCDLKYEEVDGKPVVKNKG